MAFIAKETLCTASSQNQVLHKCFKRPIQCRRYVSPFSGAIVDTLGGLRDNALLTFRFAKVVDAFKFENLQFQSPAWTETELHNFEQDIITFKSTALRCLKTINYLL